MKFSVIVPAYNAERFIDVAIQSVLSQTYCDFELIIVDDGSKDQTREMIFRYNDKRIKYIYQNNAGVSAARNKGILESKGEFLCFLDSDDEWKANHLEVMNSLIEKYNFCNLFISGYDIRLNNGKIVHKSEEKLKHLSKECIISDNGFELLMECGYFFHTNSMCCRRKVFDKVGLFEIGVKNGEDDDMWFRIFLYYSIAISKISTSIYDRSNCVATSKRLDVVEPYFMTRIDSILKTEEIPEYRKKSLLLWVEQNKLSRVRQFILKGEKGKAMGLLKNVDLNKSKKTRYLQTITCFLIPSKLIMKYVNKRDSGYYS